MVQKGKKYIIFFKVDFEKTYDSVWKNGLSRETETLEDYGVYSDYVNISPR